MPLVALDVQNCNEALIRLGADEINGFDDGTREAKLCNTIYETLVAALIERFPFTFTKKQMVLSRVNNFTPILNYRYGYSLPGDALRPVYKTNTPGMDFKIVDGVLHTNAEVVKVEYQYRAGEATWSPNFKLGFIYYMCKELAVALLDDKVKEEKYRKMAEETMQLARALDSQIQPSDVLQNNQFPLIAVR